MFQGIKGLEGLGLMKLSREPEICVFIEHVDGIFSSTADHKRPGRMTRVTRQDLHRHFGSSPRDILRRVTQDPHCTGCRPRQGLQPLCQAVVQVASSLLG